MFSIHARKTTIPLVLCTFFIFASFVSDHYSGDFRDTLRGAVDRREETGNSSAASDLYGLGMRLGLYFQGLGMILLAGQPNKRCGTGLKLIGGGIGLAMLSSWTIFARQKLFSPCEAALILFLISTAIIPAELSLFKPIAIPGEGLGVLSLSRSNCGCIYLTSGRSLSFTAPCLGWGLRTESSSLPMSRSTAGFES